MMDKFITMKLMVCSSFERTYQTGRN